VCAWLVASALIVGTIAAVAAVYGGIAVGAARTVDQQREAGDE
jgi:uncharacterized membrane protein (DUF441 family)